MRAPDIKFTARMGEQVDRAIESASASVEDRLNRVFFNTDETRKFDYPDFQYSYPWRLRLNQNELVSVTLFVTGSLLPSPVVIPAGSYILQPANSGPPYRFVDLRRDKSVGFGYNPTPQQDIAITGTWGYWGKTRLAGALSAAMPDATTGTARVTDGSAVGAGDVLTVGTERMLVTDKTMVSTGVIWSGMSTAQANDNIIAVPDGTLFHAGETLLADSERVWIADIAGNTLVVRRGWDGTTLDAHTSGVLYAARQLAVTRGDFGTTAASHLSAAACVTTLVPSLVRDLTVAEAVIQLTQEPSAYSAGGSSTGGTGGQKTEPNPGTGIGDLRCRVESAYGRQARSRAV
jgi:hypothetical protein